MESSLNYPAQPEVFYRVEFTLGSKDILFNYINSAWCSIMHEEAGKMYFPKNWFNDIHSPFLEEDFAPALVITLFHHPERWLTPNNRRDFRKIIDSVSDILMSGHEHVGDTYEQIREKENNFHVFEAEFLQEEHILRKPSSADFNS